MVSAVLPGGRGGGVVVIVVRISMDCIVRDIFVGVRQILLSVKVGVVIEIFSRPESPVEVGEGLVDQQRMSPADVLAQ